MDSEEDCPLTPTFDHHRLCIEEVIATPPSPDSDGGVSLLTCDASPTEHVLRGTKSFAARSFRSRDSHNSLRVPSNNNENSSIPTQNPPVSAASRGSDVTESRGSRVTDSSSASVPMLGEIAPNNQALRPANPKLRPSPTPSIRKKKVEAIVKAHGSPTHVRVTAGGRIVPSEQSPLCHPRYGYSAVKTNGGLIKFAPNYNSSSGGRTQWTPATENGFIAQDINGNLCQIVDGTIMPLNEVDGALQLFIPAPNLQYRGATNGPPVQNAGQRASSLGKIVMHADAPPAPQANNAVPLSEPPIGTQLGALETEYTKLEHELKDVDKTEVIHGRNMTRVSKEALINKRRELVINMDKIRKAIKALKSQPPPNAPTSPRAMMHGPSMSPSRSRLPPFLQMQQQHAMMPPPMPYYGGAGPSQFPGPYGMQHGPPGENAYGPTPWSTPPASMFPQPPPYEGSMVRAYPAFPQQSVPETSAGVDRRMVRSDSARPSADIRIPSPDSHAVPIKAPEPKSAITLKSALNPMSPAYRPAGVAKGSSSESQPLTKSDKGKAAMPLGPLSQLKPSAPGQQKTSTASIETISPVKKNAHLQSSSVSSFETADFFPHNTREYSIRQHAYGDRVTGSDEKENRDPERFASASPDQRSLDVSPAKYQATAAPPGTPVHVKLLPAPTKIEAIGQRHSQSLDNGTVPNREAHNVSPKSKRNFLIVCENPENYAALPSSSPEKFNPGEDELSVINSPPATIDFSQKPREWIEGYQAGLQSRSVGADRSSDFLDGYCSGLLKSKPAVAAPSNAAAGPSPVVASTSSPMKSHSRRPSPAVPSRPSSRLQFVEKAIDSRPPLETAKHSRDTLKQAVYAAHNENALLTPLPDGMHVNEAPLNLGAWAKAQGKLPGTAAIAAGEGFPNLVLPSRTSSVVNRRGADSASAAKRLPGPSQQSYSSYRTAHETVQVAPVELSGNSARPTSPVLSTKSFISTSDAQTTIAGNRISSVTSIDSNLYRPFPGQFPSHRVISPMDWKSVPHASHAAGLAAGYFAHGQFDGAARAPSVTSATHETLAQSHPSRFHEGSLDGLDSPPGSPRAAASPTTSPGSSPGKLSSRMNVNRKESSPTKTSSPAKAKFEHIAERVGIKTAVSGSKSPDPAAGATTAEPGSPSGKRRWRDVWRKPASKEDGSA